MRKQAGSTMQFQALAQPCEVVIQEPREQDVPENDQADHGSEQEQSAALHLACKPTGKRATDTATRANSRLSPLPGGMALSVENSM